MPPADLVNAAMMVEPSRNINLMPYGREKRGGTDIMGTTSDGTEITGLFQFKPKAGDPYLIIADSGGELWRDFENKITPAAGALAGAEPVHMSAFKVQSLAGKNEVFFCQESDPPHVWNGDGLATVISDLPSDWNGIGGNKNYPIMMVTHGRGASQRRWACGGALDPGIIYVSANNDGQDFSDANVILIRIDTGDGYGIVALAEFGDRLFAFGRKKTYLIDDSSISTSYWGYVPAQWEGGVAHHRVLVKTPNDIVAMAEDGEIYSIVAVNQYGDYKKNSLTAASYIRNWIKEYVDLTQIDKFHGLYDPSMRVLKFFVVRKGFAHANTALVYFVDRPAEQAWMVHDNRLKNGAENTASGYKATVSAIVEKQRGSYKVYTGDTAGRVWELERANRSDDGNAYYAGFKTPPMGLENPRTEKLFAKAEIITRPEGSYDVEMDWWIDTVAKTSRTIALSSTDFILNDATYGVLGTSTLGGEEITEREVPLGAVGRRLEMEFYNDTADENFLVSEVLIDNKTLGAEPK